MTVFFYLCNIFQIIFRHNKRQKEYPRSLEILCQKIISKRWYFSFFIRFRRWTVLFLHILFFKFVAKEGLWGIITTINPFRFLFLFPLFFLLVLFFPLLALFFSFFFIFIFIMIFVFFIYIYIYFLTMFLNEELYTVPKFQASLIVMIYKH